MEQQGTAIVVGVGAAEGLGFALAARAAREGLHAFLAGRDGARVEALAARLRAEGRAATGVAADATREEDVLRLFDRAEEAGPLALVVYNAGNASFHDFRTMDAAFFEAAWRVGCLGGFLVGREAARRMTPRGAGTVLFTGASASLRGRGPFAAFAAAKAGLRMVAQTMARELGPLGIHVAHVIVDGGIRGERLATAVPALVAAAGEDALLDIHAIADTYWMLHRQHRSAWTHELDLRPWKESF